MGGRVLNQSKSMEGARGKVGQNINDLIIVLDFMAADKGSSVSIFSLSVLSLQE